MNPATAADWLLGGVLFPIWLAAGVGDYLCHRATRIETTSGIPESVTHLATASLMGTGAIALMFLEYNALLLAFLTLLFVAHEIVVQIDLRVAQPLRAISPIEQQIHAFLEAAPFAALAVVATVTLIEERYVFAVRLRDPTPSAPLIAALLVAMTTLGAIPYWEEFWRCLRHARPTPIVPS
jgi:hypothetical protein